LLLPLLFLLSLLLLLLGLVLLLVVSAWKTDGCGIGER
jgi:hypothetical protein